MNIVQQHWRKRKPLALREALADCVLHQSERAKSFLYKKYYGYVMAVVGRYVAQEMEAEESVNESFVKAFRKIDSFQMHDEDDILDRTFRSWLARIAVNTSIDLLRSKKMNNVYDEVSEENLLSHSVMINDQLAVEDILKLLQRLPDIQRAIFNLFEVEGFTHDEIGEKLGIPESTSRTYLTRAKHKLRKLYTEEFSISHNMHS